MWHWLNAPQQHCLSTEPTGFGSLQYELFVAHKKKALRTGVVNRGWIKKWSVTWLEDLTFYFTMNSEDWHRFQEALPRARSTSYSTSLCKSMNHNRNYASDKKASMNCMNGTKNMRLFFFFFLGQLLPFWPQAWLCLFSLGNDPHLWFMCLANNSIHHKWERKRKKAKQKGLVGVNVFCEYLTGKQEVIWEIRSKEG